MDQQSPKQEAKLKKMEILSVISFTKDTLRTLSNYEERLKNQLDVNQFNSIFFSKGEYKLLNKNFNLCLHQKYIIKTN